MTTRWVFVVLAVLVAANSGVGGPVAEDGQERLLVFVESTNIESSGDFLLLAPDIASSFSQRVGFYAQTPLTSVVHYPAAAFPFASRSEELLRLSAWHRLYRADFVTVLGGAAETAGFVGMVCGPAGAGKTALVREWLQRHSERFARVFWLPSAENDYQVQLYLTYLLAHLATPPAAEPTLNLAEPVASVEQSAAAFLDWLARREPDEEWLLVVDNVDIDVRTVEQLLPIGVRYRGMVLLIADEQRCPSYIDWDAAASLLPSPPHEPSDEATAVKSRGVVRPEHVLLLAGVEEKESLRQVFKAADRLDWMRNNNVPREERLRDRSFAKMLHEEYHGLSQPLLQAARYMQLTNASFSAYYLQLMSARLELRQASRRAHPQASATAEPSELTDSDWPSGQHQASKPTGFAAVAADAQPCTASEALLVATLLNVRHVERLANPSPFYLLRLLALLHTCPLPLDHVVTALSLLSSSAHHHDPSPASSALHDAHRSRVHFGSAASVLDAVDVLAELDLCRVDKSTKPPLLYMTPSVRGVLRLFYGESAQLAWYDSAVQLLEFSWLLSSDAAVLSKDTSAQQLPPPNLQTLLLLAHAFPLATDAQRFSSTLLQQMALILQSTRQFDFALSMYIRALRSFEKTFGPRHIAVANLLKDLAVLYQREGRLSEAIAIELRALSIFEENLGDDANVAARLASVAGMYSLQKDLSNAIRLQRRAVDILRSELARDPSRRSLEVQLKDAETKLHYYLGEVVKQSE